MADFMEPKLKETMNKFFYPESIVVIGVSLAKINLGKIIILNNLQRKWAGKLYGISTENGSIEGVPVFDSVDKLPEVPDVAIIITPAKYVPGYMKQCGEKGIKQVVIETGGFSEYSNEKGSLEAEVLQTARHYGIRVIGPNCVGVGTSDTGMMNAFGFFQREEGNSSVSVISQSGGIGNTFIRILNDNHIFWQKFASVGNKLDLDEADFLEYFLQDDKTGSIMCYLEGFNRGRYFFDLARKSEKPIIVLKSNRSEASSKIARSHTTALSTGDDIVDAAFRQTAIIRVEGEEDLRTAAKAFKLPIVRGNSVAVLSRSGGHAVITADACVKYGLNMIDFPAPYIESIKGIYKTRVINHQNPLDLGEIFDYTIFIRIVEETLKIPEVDGIIFNHLYQPSYEAASSRTFLKAVEELVARYEKPVYISLTSNAEEITDITKNHPYPTFTSPLQAVQAYALALDYARMKKARDSRGELPAFGLDVPVIESVRSGCRTEGRIPLTDEALDICRAVGVIPVKYSRVQGPAEMDLIDIKYPAAIKLLSRDASHKSDAGGVMLGIPDRAAAAAAIEAMREKISALPGRPAIDGFLVQEMSGRGEEFFIGGRRDATFGPVVMVGYGGIFIELLNDVSMRLAPVTANEAAAMIDELTMSPLFRGVRGRPPLDRDALIDALCRISSLLASDQTIGEIDINPVIVHEKGNGVSIVDSRIFFLHHDA